MDSLLAISPIDGRYSGKLTGLSDYFSEFSLIKKRLLIELLYLVELKKANKSILEIHEKFDIKEARKVKVIEGKINHDVKAVEYYLRTKTNKAIWSYIHFGLTSEDINNLAYNLLIKNFIENEYSRHINNLLIRIGEFSSNHKSLTILTRTHGQPASPSTLGKEFYVFLNRLKSQLDLLSHIALKGKINGATGNYNALYYAYPKRDWIKFSRRFIEKLGLKPNLITTQIEPKDTLVEVFQSVKRINNILLDLNNDTWMYIMLDYLKLKNKKSEVGSSTMPHKVNPIDFENSEGNLKIANGMFTSFETFQISRLQRDLSDSTMMRNIGVAFAHSLIAYKSTLKGLRKIEPNIGVIKNDLDDHWEIVAEGVQTILRTTGYPDPYGALKKLTRGKKVTKKNYDKFIEEIKTSKETKDKLKKLSPHSYTGLAKKLVARSR